MLDALHSRADELHHRFRAMNTTGRMGRIRSRSAPGGAASSSGGASTNNNKQR